MTSEKAVILLSGGLDSTTVLAKARADGYDLFAISFRYGQRHATELEAAQRVAALMQVKKHLIVNVNLNDIGGSVLTAEGSVPKGRSPEEMGSGIPVTYVPARNTVFLSLALAWAEALEARHIFIGVNALDYSGYPDCRPDYIQAFNTMANLATRAGREGRPFQIHTPLIRLTKAQIIRLGMDLGVDYSMTQSCYDPSPTGEPCRQCDSCLLRQKGFETAGIPDPLLTRHEPERKA